jgi:hypothetical protein
MAADVSVWLDTLLLIALAVLIGGFAASILLPMRFHTTKTATGHAEPEISRSSRDAILEKIWIRARASHAYSALWQCGRDRSRDCSAD